MAPIVDQSGGGIKGTEGTNKGQGALTVGGE
jgi:hypothetical protein